MAFIPDGAYISSLLLQRQRELEGFHRKVAEIEALRYGEDRIALTDGERTAGLDVHTLMLADMIESVKAAILANPAKTHFKPLRSGDAAKANSSKREAWHNANVRRIRKVLYEFVDSVVGNGFGVLKGAYTPWPTDDRQRKTQGGQKENDKDFNKRVRALKQKWGPPYAVISPHVMTFYPRYGKGDQISEVLEHSWRPKMDVYATYGITGDSDVRKKAQGRALSGSATRDFDENRARLLGSVTGQPEESVRALPYGSDATTMCLTTEYWNPDVYQVWVNRSMIYEEMAPRVGYFSAIGRSTSSKDPDKIGLSVAEPLRLMEPVINRALTRMAEAVDLQVRKRLTVKLPEGSPDGMVLGADNLPVARTFTFKPGQADALPPGADVIDPFRDAGNAYGAMPWVELLLQLSGQHGIAPIFKGMPSGSASSGYRDNSLYMMAKAQYEYLIDAVEECLAEMVRWQEDEIVRGDTDVWIDDLQLRPKDIEDFPCTVSMMLDPVLPQNLIAEGQFYMEAHRNGYGNRRWVYEKGFKEDQPEELERERLLEDAQEMLRPLIIERVIQQTVLRGNQPQPQPQQDSGLVDTQGNPLAPTPPNPSSPGGVQQLISAMGGGAGGSPGGRGQQQPPMDPGATIQPR